MCAARHLFPLSPVLMACQEAEAVWCGTCGFNSGMNQERITEDTEKEREHGDRSKLQGFLSYASEWPSRGKSGFPAGMTTKSTGAESLSSPKPIGSWWLACKSWARRLGCNSETGLQSRCGEQRWLNQHSLNRVPARRHGLVRSVRQSGMPKEPRHGPAVLGRVHQRFCPRPRGSVFLLLP